MTFEEERFAPSSCTCAPSAMSRPTRNAPICPTWRSWPSTWARRPRPRRYPPSRSAAFLAGLHARRHPATLGRKLAAIRAFFRFLVREGRCPLDPTAGISAPRTPKRLPESAARGRLHRARRWRKRSDRFAKASRTRRRSATARWSSCSTAPGCGWPRLAGLDVRDVDLHRGDVRVSGKGGKERVVPLPGAARDALGAYLAHRRSPGLLAQPLFTALRPRRDGPRRLGVRDIRRILRARARGRESPTASTPTACATATRRTCSTWAPICARSRSLLGHASLSTTEKYTAVSAERLMEVYDQAHPRARRPGQGSKGRRRTRGEKARAKMNPDDRVRATTVIGRDSRRADRHGVRRPGDGRRTPW